MFRNDFKISNQQKALLVSVVCPKFEGHTTENESTRSLDELRELLRTLGIECGNSIIQNKKNLESATLLGKGKIEEIAKQAKEEGAHILVFDFELSAGQINNIQEITQLNIADRNHIILEIFAKHARTKESKTQIEIARLQYLLPRLKGLWGHFSRQKGGVGVLGGEGEKQIELDRRLIRERIEFLKKQLREVLTSREEQKKRRKEQVITIALVGYTNAGKSSLMNRLCQVNVLEEDKLFATLDSTVRTLTPDTKPPMVLVDTVGFISNLPSTLIEGFKTTLESAIDSDLLLVVCDISDPNYKKHLEVTQEVLKELGIEEKQKIIVFNKKDLVTDGILLKLVQRTFPNSYVVSSHSSEDMKSLRSFIINFFLEKQNIYDLFIPYTESSFHSTVASRSNIITQRPHETGIFYRIRVPEFIFNTLGLHQFVLSPEDPGRTILESSKNGPI